MRKPPLVPESHGNPVAEAFSTLAAMGFQVIQPRAPYTPTLSRKPVALVAVIAPARTGRPVKAFRRFRILQADYSMLRYMAKGLGLNKAAIQATVEKAIAGERLGKNQETMIEVMLAEIADYRTDSAMPDNWAGLGVNVGHSEACPF